MSRRDLIDPESRGPLEADLALLPGGLGSIPDIVERRARARTMPGADVVVRPGQSLWTIAARLLPPTATDVDITYAWHRLHRANAATVGTDPHLILPGTRLVVPDLSAPPEESP